MPSNWSVQKPKLGVENQYKVGERVFSKIRGYSALPAKVVGRVLGKEEKYRVHFYGTHDEMVVKLDQLNPYNEKTKAKYGKQKRNGQCKLAMAEMEAEIIATAGPNSSVVVEDVETVADYADSEGELIIDEGFPSPPPVLTREASSKPESNEDSTSRRDSTLSKGDSESSASGAPVVTPTIATPETSQSSTTEIGIGSRSVRKVKHKPKRFADDEITLPAANKAGGKAAGSEERGPPAKRAKGTSKSNGIATLTRTPATREDKTEKDIPVPKKAKTVKTGAAVITPTPVLKQLGRLSPEVSAPMPPSLKAAPMRRSGSGRKKLPALIPTGGLPRLPKVDNTRSSERQPRSKSMEEEDSQNEIPHLPLKDSDDVEDKDNSANKSPDDNGYESKELLIASKKRREETKSKHGNPRIAQLKQAMEEIETAELPYLKYSNSMFEDKRFSDVLIKFKDGEFHAHRIILASSSPVFSTLLQKDTQALPGNGSANRVVTLTIDDLPGEAVQEMLRYIYTGRVNSFDRLADKLMQAAHKYGLPELKRMSEKVLYPKLQFENAIEMYNLGNEVGSEEISRRAFAILQANKSKILSQPEEFRRLTFEHLNLMVLLFKS